MIIIDSFGDYIFDLLHQMLVECTAVLVGTALLELIIYIIVRTVKECKAAHSKEE